MSGSSPAAGFPPLDHTLEHAFQAVEMMALGAIILAAHAGGKLCRRFRLPEVTGQIVGGAAVGPFALHLLGILPQGPHLYDQAFLGFRFFIFVFLSLVAFGIGEELHLDRLQRVGRAALLIALLQTVLTGLLMGLAFHYVAGLSAVEAFLIGATGVASAPAVTYPIMNQLRIEGRLRQVVGSVEVLADLMGILAFSLLIEIALAAREHGGGPGVGLLLPVLGEMLLAAAVGGGIFLALRLLVRRGGAGKETLDEEGEGERVFFHRILAVHPSPSAEVLLVVLGAVSLGAGLAHLQGWPFLISAILAGFLASNLHTHALFDSLKIDQITSVFNLVFFALMGASLSFGEIRAETAGLALLYVVTRFAGKLGGGWIACRLLGEGRKMTACLPTLLLPMAGVGAVEAVYASAVLGEPRLAAIILPAIVFFEIVGSTLTERALARWRSWVTDEEKALRSAPLASGPAEAARTLLAALPEAAVLLDPPARSKGELLRALVGAARAGAGGAVDEEAAMQLLAERERLQPTGYGHGVALPHCRLIGLKRPVLAFARHGGGIVFGGVDEAPCDLVLLILTPAHDPGEHLRLLAAAAQVLGNDAVRQRLRAARRHAELLVTLHDLGRATISMDLPPEGSS